VSYDRLNPPLGPVHTMPSHAIPQSPDSGPALAGNGRSMAGWVPQGETASGRHADGAGAAPCRCSAAGSATVSAGPDRSSATAVRERTIRTWPLILLAAPAAVAVWSGWVGIGRMTGFGLVRPLPGIWDSLHLDSAITLPIGVEAYAAYALRAWLSTSGLVNPAARRFARWSAIASLLLGMAGQVTYHLLNQAGAARAPWEITTTVACLPVLVLGMGAALAHLLRGTHIDPVPDPTRGSSSGQALPCTGVRASSWPEHPLRRDPGGRRRPAQRSIDGRLAEARATAQRLADTGAGVSRRTLRAAGLRGSNADLGALARILNSELAQLEAATTR